ncbi:Coenzyme A disulfide reductase [bioreactor metagenome]|uniref:Coenzyme A disulfide reductase n=2 Tax=root TaxID=1 RepID=A0A644WTN9_9ZZZZ
MNKIKNFINFKKPKHAAIVGTGFIGLEVCENLKKLGIEVTFIERLPQVTPGLDRDISVYVKDRVLTDASVNEITENNLILSDGTD